MKSPLLDHPTNENMMHYHLHYVQTECGEEKDYYWRCWADDYEHAVEQLKSEVEECQGEEVLFHELIEESV